MVLLLACLFLTSDGYAATRILFAGRTSDVEDYELYSMSTNGTDLVQLTTNTVSEWGPALGPDTNSVAYIDPAAASNNPPYRYAREARGRKFFWILAR